MVGGRGQRGWRCPPFGGGGLGAVFMENWGAEALLYFRAVPPTHSLPLVFRPHTWAALPAHPTAPQHGGVQMTSNRCLLFPSLALPASNNQRAPEKTENLETSSMAFSSPQGAIRGSGLLAWRVPPGPVPS